MSYAMLRIVGRNERSDKVRDWRIRNQRCLEALPRVSGGLGLHSANPFLYPSYRIHTGGARREARVRPRP
jgi:hypothetical protein